VTAPTPDELSTPVQSSTPEPEPRSEAWAATAPEPQADDEAVDDSLLDARTREVLSKARREAANLRRRLHDAEQRAAQVDELQEQLGAAAAREGARDKAEAERIAAESLIDPTDLWAQSADVQRFYDDEFASIVPDKVREATAAIVKAKPHLARPQTAPPPSNRPIEGLRSGARPAEETKPITWASALHGR
jgi:hypothetical protein